MSNRRQHTTLLVYLLLSICNVQAQQFEWASAGGNLNAGYRGSALDDKGNIIVVGETYLPSGYYGKGSYLYSSAGDSVEIAAGSRPLIVVSFDPSGKINWKQEIRNGGEPVGVAINSKHIIKVLSAYGHLYSFDQSGRFLDEVSTGNKLIRNANSFFINSEDQLLVNGRKVTDTVNKKGYHEQLLFTSITCFDDSLHTIWESSIQHETGSSMIPDCVMDIAPDGNIYIGFTILVGGSFGGKKPFKTVIIDSVSPYNQPYEAFLACYSKNGELKWTKRSGGKSIICSIKANESGVMLGGTIMNNISFFGMKADTTKNKRMFLAKFDNKGNTSWLKTSTAHSIKAITTDQEQNIYAVVQSKTPVMVYEGDSLRNVYESLIIASYTRDGRFRWVKNCKIPMSTNQFPQIKTDPCGNIYVSGEMWSVLKSKMNWFDAAFVKGDGYGDGAFVGKLKNTLPPKIAEVISHKKNACIISPAPWTIFNYPNPFSGQTTIQFKITYDDPAVTLQVYDLNGKLITNVFSGQPMKAGIHTRLFSAGSLSKGVYVAVLKGTEAVATEKIVLQ